MIQDTLLPSDDIVDVGTISGGGAVGIWAWRSVMGLHNSGFPFDMIGGTSTGCIVAFLYAKEFYDEAEKLYKITYDQGSKNIFESGISEVKKGKLEINWFKALTNVFKIKKVKSLMTNQGLYETFLRLEKMKPGSRIPVLFNTVSLSTGASIQNSSDEFVGRPEQYAAALTASTSMPGILPWWNTDEYKFLVDGGLTTGLAINEMFGRMTPGKPYRFWNVMCNPIDLLPEDQITNAAQVIGRSLSIVLNKTLRDAIGRTADKNHVAKVIWPISDKLELMGLQNLADELRAALGYRYVPINNIIYSGNRGVFDFTPESYNEQIITAENDVKNFLAGQALK